MSLTASMWTSVSGLLAHGEKMNVIGNNISNVNTVGFKSQRMDFQDFVYQNMGTASGMGQVGRGTSIGIIMNDFDQGSLESTTSDTDIAISGAGFFSVKPKTTNQLFYTRAGNFSFDKDGYLVDPHGYVLQGWHVDNESMASTTDGRNTSGIVGSGVPTDIQLDTFTCPPRHTTSVTLPINLKLADKTENDKSNDATDPFFALLKTWDASDLTAKPLGDKAYAYPSTIEVFDEGGRSHTLTIYFDRVEDGVGSQSITGASPNENLWEFIVTMEPSEDVRNFGSTVDDIASAPNVPAKLKGLLGAGTLSFDDGGNMTDLAFFVPPAGQWWDASAGVGKEVVDLTTWVAAPFSTDGFPVFAPNFSGAPGEQSAYKNGTWDRPNPDASGKLVSLDFGLRNTIKTWSFPTGYTGADAVYNMPLNGPGGLALASDVANVKTRVRGLDGKSETLNTKTTCLGDSFYELSAIKQNGYTYGDLLGVSVNTNGVLSASYSNGITLQLFQLTLYDFPSKQNLRREGGNLFSETRASGVPNSGAAGTGIFGSTIGRNLEQSNADISREFVNMITTQRGFQANSKTITTVDTMLETVISMKR